MALSILEKLGLQKQAAALKTELKSGNLGIMDKLAKQRELAVLMATLKGEAKPTEPVPGTSDEEDEVSDEEAEKEASRSVQGFELAGVTHPAWTRQYAEKAGLSGGDVVLSNVGLEMAIILPSLSSASKVTRDKLLIAWPSYLDGTSQADDHLSIPANRAWEGVYSPFPPKLRKKVRRMVEQAVNVVNKSFDDGIGEYTLTRQPEGIIRVTLGQQMGEGWTVGIAASMLKQNDHGLEVVAGLLDEGQGRAARAKLYSQLAELEYTGDKLSTEERTKAIEQLRQLVNRADLVTSADMIRETLDKLVAQQPADVPDTTSLSVRYMRGDFNTEGPDMFRTRILGVAEEGMELENIKTGVTGWIGANSELIAA